ncbi:MAG: hypothetical protein ACLFTT_16605 [Candidatus Hydrogenedentota bacterium]
MAGLLFFGLPPPRGRRGGRRREPPIPGIIKYFYWSFLRPDKAKQGKSLRFNPIQIAEWLDDLSNLEQFSTPVTLAGEFNLSKPRIIQHLNLLRIPQNYRLRLRDVEGLSEYQLRPIVHMTPKYQKQAIKRLLKHAER